MTKKQRQQFIKRVTQLLLDLGAVQSGDDFILQTKAGKLTIHPTENRTSGPGTVFARFDDPQAARQLVECNPFSGKWNHHYFDGWETEPALHDLLYQLKTVLA